MDEQTMCRHSIAGDTPEARSASLWLRLVALAQALYYIITGIWPLVSIDTFQKVTGPKVDRWLVKIVGALITVVGGVLMVAGLRRRPGPEATLLAIGSAGVLAAGDVVYVAKRRISPIYLLDALGELLLIAGWIAALSRRTSVG
ncbi:MAG TPA: hypothetical protein VFZ66_23465 [Herpetosiphonaceae bacterium]